MSVIKWEASSSVVTFISAGSLNSLTSGSEVTSSAHDNSTELDMLMDLILAIQYNAGPPTAGARVADLYLLPTPDGTNYPTTGSDGLPQKALQIASLECRSPSTSALEYLVVQGIPIPPGSFKILLSNISGQTLHSSASMFLKGRKYKVQSV